MTDPFRHDDAAYVLGALGAEERDVFEAHLLGCAECRARVAEISHLPGLLRGIDPSDFTGATEDAGPVPDTLLPRLVREARRRRSRTGWFVGAAAGIAAGVAVALTLLLTGSPAAPQPGPARAMQALVATPVHADVTLTAEDWGTRVTVHCRYYAGGGTTLEYEMTLHDRRGRPYALGGWRITGGDEITYVAGAPVPENQIASIDVTTPRGVPILRLRT